METDMAMELRPFYNVGPGDLIQDSLDALGWQQEDLADVTGLTLQTINKLVKNRQSITVETANLLGKAFNTSAELWLNLDAAHQLRKHVESDRERLAEKKAKLRRYMPLAEMRKKGWFLYDNDGDGLTRECQRLFGEDDLPEDVYESSASYCARRGKADESYTAWYSTTWYLVAREYASSCDLPRFNRKKLEALAGALVSYTLMQDGVPAVLRGLASCGIGFFVLRHLQKTYLDGASFYVGRNPFIVYTGRYDRVDNFWLIVAHEIAHILHHLSPDSVPVLDNLDNEGDSAMEIEADTYASAYLRTAEIVAEGSKIGRYLTPERLLSLSRKVGVSVPVAVGILQRHGILERRQCSRYRETVLERIPEEFVKG